MVRNYWSSQSRAYHHTAPINMNFAFHEALRLVLEEGLEQRWERHRRNHAMLRAGLEAMGLQYVVAKAHRLPMLNSVRIPDGVDDKAARGFLLSEYGIEIGGGLGPMAGKVWRHRPDGGRRARSGTCSSSWARSKGPCEPRGVSVPAGAGVAAALAAET